MGVRVHGITRNSTVCATDRLIPHIKRQFRCLDVIMLRGISRDMITVAKCR